jgi:hypothetical protein
MREREPNRTEDPGAILRQEPNLFYTRELAANKCAHPAHITERIMLSKQSEVASSCWRPTERPLHEKGETNEEKEKRNTPHTPE